MLLKKYNLLINESSYRPSVCCLSVCCL